MTRLVSRISHLERTKEEAERVGNSGGPWWWELPDDEWHLGAVGLSHEEALRAALSGFDKEDEEEEYP